ncbi:MAG: hypothetical protein ABSD48_01465 [Armatimonadota bacterium]|jgi:hypothetical protein
MKSLWIKLLISLPLLVLLVLLDQVTALQGLPLLAVTLGLALLAAETARVRLHAQGRANVAMLPFMAATLVLLLAFCKGRHITQGVLFIVTVGVVFNILMVALSLIGEASKRGAKGILEFAGLTVIGLALGVMLSLILLAGPGHMSGVSLAGP